MPDSSCGLSGGSFAHRLAVGFGKSLVGFQGLQAAAERNPVARHGERFGKRFRAVAEQKKKRKVGGNEVLLRPGAASRQERERDFGVVGRVSALKVLERVGLHNAEILRSEAAADEFARFGEFNRIRIGVDGYFGYPITPQSEVLETLAEQKPWETTGMVVLQAESEVAAINMVYGGAGSGKMVMTSSSSPGGSLKQEGISYIAGA